MTFRPRGGEQQFGKRVIASNFVRRCDHKGLARQDDLLPIFALPIPQSIAFLATQTTLRKAICSAQTAGTPD